jgi:hypothetical protein
MAHVQTVSVFAEFVTSVTTPSVTSTSGDSVCMGCFNAGAYTLTPSDSNSNTWGPNSANPQIISSFIWSQAYLAENITGGSGQTYKISSSTTDILALIVSEFSGRATTGQPDAQGGTTNSSGSATCTGPALVCAASDDVWMLGCIPQGHTTVTVTAGSGYTIPTNGNLMTDYNCSFVEYQNAVGAGTVTPTATFASSQLYTTLAYGLLAGGGGGGIIDEDGDFTIFIQAA